MSKRCPKKPHSLQSDISMFRVQHWQLPIITHMVWFDLTDFYFDFADINEQSPYRTTAISRLKMIFEQWQSRTHQSPHALYCCCKNKLSAASTWKHLRPRPASLVYYCRHCPQLLTTHLKQEVIGPGMRSLNISEGGNLRGQTTCLLLLGGDLSAVHGKPILLRP